MRFIFTSFKFDFFCLFVLGDYLFVSSTAVLHLSVKSEIHTMQIRFMCADMSAFGYTMYMIQMRILLPLYRYQSCRLK